MASSDIVELSQVALHEEDSVFGAAPASASGPAAVNTATVDAPQGDADSAAPAAPSSREQPYRPVSPETVEAMQRLGQQQPSVFAVAQAASFEDYLSSGSAAPVYGIPVVCTVPTQAASSAYPPHTAPYYSQPPAPYPQPLSVPPPPMFEMRFNDTSDVRTEVETLWSLSRGCRIYAAADMFIVCLLVLSRYWIAALLPFPIVGFIGARRYKGWMVVAYLSYFPLILAVRAFIAYQSASQDDTSGSMKVVLIILAVIGGIAEMYIAWCVWKLRKGLQRASAAALSTLRNGWQPANVRFSI